MFLNYLLGFRRLGYDVLLVDQLDDCAWPAGDGPHTGFRGVRSLARTLTRFGLQDAYSVLGGDGAALAGMARSEVLVRVGEADVLINVMGYLRDPELLARARRRVFLDIDPGFPQMWRALGLADVMDGHDAFVTLGSRIGEPDCEIPTCDLPWITTRPPVVLEHWPVARAPSAPDFTVIGAWRGPFDPIEYRGRRYGLRAHEFRRLAGLPTEVPARFRAALDMDPADAADRDLLCQGGWELLDPVAGTGNPWRYRELIGAAGAELMVAKELYVATRSGWFSDRSACFLASGKPVLALDTGFPAALTARGGLLSFDRPAGAVAGARSILEDYPGHARAARALAEEWFDSDLVLRELMEGIEAA